MCEVCWLGIDQHFSFKYFSKSALIYHFSSDASGYFRPMHKKAKSYENHLNPIMLIFIGKLFCQGINHFSDFCHHVMLTKLATSGKRVRDITKIVIKFLGAIC